LFCNLCKILFLYFFYWAYSFIFYSTFFLEAYITIREPCIRVVSLSKMRCWFSMNNLHIMWFKHQIVSLKSHHSWWFHLLLIHLLVLATMVRVFAIPLCREVSDLAKSILNSSLVWIAFNAFKIIYYLIF